jgi:spermidine/putrescine transport system ATP-binding protein
MAAEDGRQQCPEGLNMTEPAVEIRNVSKIFSSRRGKNSEDVYAVREMNLSIPRGKFFTLLGPSGCGKTTTLRLIAGFETPTTGEVVIQNKAMSKVPPNLRPVNTVFQNYALFPHLNVARNVGFGLEVKRVRRSERERLVGEALDLVKLGDMGDRKPSQLSGGQQQRVALARALVNRPAVLLLDEPLGALDLKLRKAMQIELKHIQEQVGITFVYVTHDQEEALTMSDLIAVMKDGLIQQLGDPLSLYKSPANKFVADFIGESNFIQGRVDSLEEGGARITVAGEMMDLDAEGVDLQPGQAITFTIRPEKINLSKPGKGGLTGTVHERVFIGTDTRYLVMLSSGEEIIVRVQNGCGSEAGEFNRGDQVVLTWSPQDARMLND